MPTGYTHELLDKNLSFEQFACLCARNFCALIMHRDGEFTPNIPDVETPSNYHTEAVEKARAKHAELMAMNEVERLAYGEAKRDKMMNDLRESKKKDEEQNRQLREMLYRAQSWRPPTKDHEGLKQFMIEQLQMSMHNIDWYGDELRKANVTPFEAWREDVDKATRDVAYHIKEHGEEVSRCASRTAWIQALKLGLGMAVKP